MISNSQSSATKLKQFFEYDTALTELDIPELTNIDTETSVSTYLNGLYINNPSLKKINFENLEQSPFVLLGNNLTSVNLSNLKRIEPKLNYTNILNQYILYSFLSNTKIRELNLPNFEGVTNSSTYEYGSSNSLIPASFFFNYWLKNVSFGNKDMETLSNVHLNGYWFQNCYFLKYLRINYPFFIPLSSTQGLGTTPMASGPRYGRIYVPSNLVNYYKGENGGAWATFRDNIFPLEQYEIDISEYNNNSLDNVSWATIINDCNTGNIENYQIGQTKTIYVNGIPTEMIIVGKSQDTIANTNNKASLTWIEKTLSRFEPVNVYANTDKIYSSCSNFKELMENLYDGIEDTTLKNGIKSVTKQAYGFTSTSVDPVLLNLDSEGYKLWPPSLNELGFDSKNYTYPYFKPNDTNTPPNYRLGETNIYVKDGNNINIALRDFRNLNNIRPAAIISGENNSILETNPSNTPYIIFGFCT